VAIKDKEYLKSVFEKIDRPIEDDYVDLIDSCFNNSISGQTVYFDDVLCLNGAKTDLGVILTNPLGFEYLLTIQNGVLSAIKI
jgi:hypothetical protein